MRISVFETMQQALFDSFVGTDPYTLLDTEEAADVPEPHLDAGAFEADAEQGQSGPTILWISRSCTLCLRSASLSSRTLIRSLHGDGDSDPEEDKVDEEITAAPAPEPSAPSGIRRASPSRSRTRRRRQRRRRRSTSSTPSRSRSRTRRRWRRH